MSLQIDAFIGRGNARDITLTQDAAPVANDVVTRAVLFLGGNCLDTAEPTDPIELIENNTKIRMQLGLWSSAVPGNVEGHLVVYQAAYPDGLAWPENETISVTFHAWEVCP